MTEQRLPDENERQGYASVCQCIYVFTWFVCDRDGP